MNKVERKEHYVDNESFYLALVEYRKAVRRAKREKQPLPYASEYIGECLIKIANHLSYLPSFINYPFREDMILDGIENCLAYIDNFDPKKSRKPFAYFTQICYYSFLRRIQKEKKLLKTKYEYISSLGLDEIIRQAHDAGEYDNQFIRYLQTQADIANKELSESSVPPSDKKYVRRPKYLEKAHQKKLKRKRRKKA